MRTRYSTAPEAGVWPTAVGSPSPQRIRWGAVFGGAVIGVALLALLTTLWFALAYGSGVDAIRTNLAWYIGISAIVCLFIGGILAGWLSGVNGVGSGFFNGVAIWALALVVTVTVGVPAILNVFNLGRVSTIDTTTTGLLTQSSDTVLWATFAAIVGGLLAAGVGGMIGGAMTRPANAHLLENVAGPVPATTEIVDRPARPDIRDEDDRTVVIDHDDEDVRRVS
jgi:hypothetical protein